MATKEYSGNEMKDFLHRDVIGLWVKRASLLLLCTAIAGCGGGQSSGPTWSVAQALAAGSVGEPAVTSTANGMVYVAWGRSALFVDAPYIEPGSPTTVRQFKASAGWQPASQFGSASPAKSDGLHRLAANDAGAVVVTWVEYDHAAGTPRVMVNRFSPASGWVGALSLDENNSATDPRVVIDAAGTATVAWKRIAASGATLVSASSSGASGAWSESHLHADGLGSFELALGESERPTLVFTGRNASGMWVNAATSQLASGEWSAPAALSEPAGDARGPCSTLPCPYDGYANLQLASNGRGVMTATWESLDERTSTIHVWASVKSGAAGWTPPASIAEEYFFTTVFAQAQAVIDGAGNVTVIWRGVGQSAGATRQLKMRRHMVSAGWQATTTESRFTGRLEYSDIAVAATPDGGFFLAWNETGPLVAHWTPAEGWHDFHSLGSANSTQSPSDGKVSIAADSSGVATATWMHVAADWKSGTVFASRFE